MIDEAIDAALLRSGLEVIDVDLPGWLAASAACGMIIEAEAVQSNQALLADAARRDLLGDEVRARLALGAAVTGTELARARAAQQPWREALLRALSAVDLLVLPTVPFFPPSLAQAGRQRYTVLTNPVNLSGFPALALPVPSSRRLPASLQLIGPPNSEALLLATGAIIEATAGYLPVS